MINQGSSEVSLVFGVLQEYENRILQALYEEFLPMQKHNDTIVTNPSVSCLISVFFCREYGKIEGVHSWEGYS